MAISKKLRFEVFKRDGFLCGYCGKTPPQVVLEVDHINPRSLEGDDDINNLITACFDCNRGKKDIPLNKVPNSIIENMEILKEKEEQLKEYQRLVKKIKVRESKEIEEIALIYNSYFKNWSLTERFKEATLRKFVRSLNIETIKESMHYACQRINEKDGAVRYFCGICWKRIKNG